MKIRTCQFNDSYFPIMDGVGMTAHNYAYWLNKKYGKAALVAPKVKGYEDDVDYKVFRFKSVLIPGMNPYRVGLPLLDVTFKKKLRRTRFDILHAHSPFVSGQLAQKMAHELKIPLVATFHTKYREDFRKVLNNELFIEFLMKLTLDFYNAADQVWVPNRATGETLKEYGYGGKFEIVPNGSDMKFLEIPKRLKSRQKGFEMTGLDANDFILLFVGQHRWEKNVQMIIEALKMLKDKARSFKMVFVGEGYAAKEMKQIVKEYDLKDRVKFLGPIIDRKELSCIYSIADLFVFPSMYDNSPLVIQEAAAFDIPSIVVKNSSSAEGITDKVNGFLVDNSPEALALTISELMNYPEIIQLTGEGARKSLYKNWETIVDEAYLRYLDVIESYQGKHPEILENDEDLV
jgi:1,2-diacylglycerol 3-alpha-glucosyltransferase